MQANTSALWHLTTLLNSLFSKEALRRNNYIFNSLNDRMELPIRTIAKERKVAQITSDYELVVQVKALKQCPAVEVVSGNTIKVLMRGDEVIVKIGLPEGKKIPKKEVQTLAKQMKCEIKENYDHYLVEFQSHAATVEFVERAKAANKNYIYQILEKDPYKCLQESINNYRTEKKNPKPNSYHDSHQTYGSDYSNYGNSYNSYNLAQYYSQQYPTFIRKAIPSDDQFPQTDQRNNQNPKKYMEKPKTQQTRPRFDSEDFPTFDKLTICSAQPKNE